MQAQSPASAALRASEAIAAASASTSPLPASSPDFAALLKPFTPDAFANGFATLVGALVGAMLAYLLQRRLQANQEHKVALMAAHRLMFSLLQQMNTIILIQRDYVFPQLSNPGRFISIPATPPYDPKKNVLELPELSFMLENGSSRKLLYEFYIAQENYIEAINQWNLRSDFHLERLQPALACSGIPNGGLVTEAALRKALGEQVFSHAVNATNNAVESLQRAFQKLAPLKDQLRPHLIARFKTSDFTDFAFEDTWGLANPPASPNGT